MAYFLIVMLAISSYVDSSSIDSISSAAQSVINDSSKPWEQPHLPGTIRPIHYHLNITPNFYLNNSQFSGRVSIQIRVNNQTNAIIVHKKKLQITGWKVLDKRGREMEVNRTFENKENNYWIALTKRPLPRDVTLNLTFKGNLPDVQNQKFNHSGLYKIPFFDSTTRKQSWLLATDFYPTYSRYVFPNFDEPRFKARFNITIRHWKSFTAQSNMPEESVKTMNNIWKETTFQETPKLSSHRIAFFISEFQYRDIFDNNTLYRLWARRGRLNKADYALNSTLIMQNFLRKEFGMIKDLPKIDQFALPGHPLIAGWKNWGINIYKESGLLVNMTAENAAKYRTLTLIAQTLTQNYFGNLVTCRFWSHIWLNEGLTAFYEVKTVRAVDPSFGYKEVYFGEKIEAQMNFDATNASKALVPYSVLPKADLYDSILYTKGAAILRMVENFVGTDAFRRGIMRYLTENSFSTVVTEDLWSAIQQQVGRGLDIETIMRTWIYGGGIPIITVELLSGNQINATQKQFIEDPLAIPDPNYRWYVPLTYRTKGGNYSLVWMNRTDVVFDVPLSSSDDWIEFNVDRTGYYRVNYDATLWQRITRQLNINHTVFTELTRSMLISDALNIIKAEQLRFDVFLGLTKYASVEKGLVPWYHIFGGLKYLNSKVVNRTIFSRFQRYVLNLTSKPMDELQVKDEGCCLEKQLRPKIMSLSCFAGHGGCIENTTRLFKAWIQNEPNDVDADFRRQVYCLGMAHSTLESEWNATFERYRQATLFSEKFEWLFRLSCSRNVTLLERFLDFNINSANRDDIHIFIFIKYIGKNPSTEDCAWNWLKRKYAEIDRKVRIGFTAYLLPEAVTSFKTRAQYQQLLDFYTVYTSVTENVKQLIKEQIDRNIHFMDRNFAPVANWLEQNVQR